MKITIISGSHRSKSQSEKVARYIESVFNQSHNDVEPMVYTLANNPLPLWDEAIWQGDESWVQRLAPLKQQLADSDAFVVVAPEWHGQVPAGLKNFFLMFGRFELGHKPALIVAVSAGSGGAYPVAELRMSSYKNNRLCYIPEQLIIRDVENVLNPVADDNNAESDGYYRGRIAWSLDILKGYGEALAGMRAATELHHDAYTNGM